MASEAAAAPSETTALPTAVLDKYKSAGTLIQTVLQTLIPKIVEGASVLALCQDGDKLVEEATAKLFNKTKGMSKGIAFPTSLSINNVLQNSNPLPSDADQAVLKKDDVVKVMLGAQFDGYAVISADTVVVTTETVTGIRADLLQAANQAAELALRIVKPGVKNWDITESIKQLVAAYPGVEGVEGIISQQFEQNSIESKKGIVAFPTEQIRRDSDNAYTLEEGEVYGLNIILTSGDKTPKAADASQTTVYQKTTSTYLLKMKTSRATFSEISKKAGAFPFTLRMLEEESKARMGVRECVSHGLLKPFEVSTTAAATDLSVQVFVTFAVGKVGATRLSLPTGYYTAEKVKSEVVIPEELKSVLDKPIKTKAPKKKGAKVE